MVVVVVGEVMCGVMMDLRPPFCGERGFGLRLRVVRVGAAAAAEASAVGAGETSLLFCLERLEPVADFGAGEVAEAERLLERVAFLPSLGAGETVANRACAPILGVVVALRLPPFLVVGFSFAVVDLLAAPAAFVSDALSASALTALDSPSGPLHLRQPLVWPHLRRRWEDRELPLHHEILLCLF